MTVEFKYQIGQVVTHITMQPPYLNVENKWLGQQQQLLTIIGRVADECPGGTQKHYRCRITDQSRGISPQIIQFHEEELVTL